MFLNLKCFERWRGIIVEIFLFDFMWWYLGILKILYEIIFRYIGKYK